MNQEAYAGQMPHIIETAAPAGFQGLEAEICMLGPYFDRPEEAALTDRAIAFLKHFPFARLMVSHTRAPIPGAAAMSLRRGVAA